MHSILAEAKRGLLRPNSRGIIIIIIIILLASYGRRGVLCKYGALAGIDRGTKLSTVRSVLTKATQHIEQRDAVCGALLLILDFALTVPSICQISFVIVQYLRAESGTKVCTLPTSV